MFETFKARVSDHGAGTYETNKICLPCFYDKIYIENNRCNGLALGYES